MTVAKRSGRNHHKGHAIRLDAVSIAHLPYAELVRKMSSSDSTKDIKLNGARRFLSVMLGHPVRKAWKHSRRSDTSGRM